MPSLTLEGASTVARDIPERKVAIGGSIVSLGGGIDSAVIANDQWSIPLLGVAAYGAIGSYDTIVTSVDGSIARIRPWTTYEIDVLLPGVGYRMIKRRYMFSAALRGGLVFLTTQGAVAAGADETAFGLSGLSPLVQAELLACRRLDPLTRVCLQVAPRIYDFGFMNGATFGVRVEWGR